MVILWSRLGTRLPAGIFSRPDGRPYLSGTEFEFEDAAESFRMRGLPDLLVYRKTAKVVTELDSKNAVLERQPEAVADRSTSHPSLWKEG